MYSIKIGNIFAVLLKINLFVCYILYTSIIYVAVTVCFCMLVLSPDTSLLMWPKKQPPLKSVIIFLDHSSEYPLAS